MTSSHSTDPTLAQLIAYLELMCKGKEFQHIVVLLVVLIAEFDGNVSDDEREFVAQLCTEWKVDFATIAPLVQNESSESLRAILKLSRSFFNEESREVIMDVAILACMADDKLVYGELLLLQLIADALGISGSKLKSKYKRITGSDFPPPADPSSKAYYARENGRQGSSGSRTDNQSERDVELWLAILGLERGATIEEIKKRYRLLALTKHPDRNPDADPETRKVMNDEFIRIKHAYERLIGFYA